MELPSPGLSYAAKRVLRTAFPKLAVTAPAQGIRVERDVAVLMRDGVKLRVNVFRPDRDGRFPVIMCAHPYGKDVLPKRSPFGYLPLARYRFIRQPDPITFSAYTSWEAPDPSYWVPRGYALVNVDLRGFGTSEGSGTFLSDQEAADYAEAIEWAAAPPWSTGRVGLNGVSYLAISQWKVAALRPKSLAAICPWEGWTDFYRDVAYPGGVREDGFVPFWANMTERAGRVTESLRQQQLAHPEWDDFWASRRGGPRLRRSSPIRAGLAWPLRIRRTAWYAARCSISTGPSLTETTRTPRHTPTRSPKRRSMYPSRACGPHRHGVGQTAAGRGHRDSLARGGTPRPPQKGDLRHEVTCPDFVRARGRATCCK
jgi:predicted acyl esterase